MVGFSPSRSVNSVRPSGPRTAISPSTEYWVGVRPSSVEVAFSRRASLLMTPLRRATISTSIAPRDICLLVGRQVLYESVTRSDKLAGSPGPIVPRPPQRSAVPRPCPAELVPTGAELASSAGEPLPRRKLVFAIVSMALFMSSVDQTIVATGLPAIQREL